MITIQGMQPDYSESIMSRLRYEAVAGSFKGVTVVRKSIRMGEDLKSEMFGHKGKLLGNLVSGSSDLVVISGSLVC
jgi:hypothetical protein